MTCRRSTLKKYQGRPSPPFPAQDCKGKQKKGNDGQFYVSVPSSTGVYRWTLASPSSRTKTGKTQKKQKIQKLGKGGKTYLIHDNGARPFSVVVYAAQKKLEVYVNDEPVPGEHVKGKKIYETSYSDLFIGDNTLPDPMAEYPKGTAAKGTAAKGNTFLVHVSGSKYVHIGAELYSFETRDGEKIVHYYSPIGGSDVPYPYAVGENYTYFLLDDTTVPNEVLDLKKDGYTQYYGYPFQGQKREESEKYRKMVIAPVTKKFRRTVMYKS